MKAIPLLTLVLFIAGCAAPPAANFLEYDTNVAWDAALLLDIDCNDYIDGKTCSQKKGEAQEIIKSLVPELSQIDHSKLTCLYSNAQGNNEYDLSGSFLDFIEDNYLQQTETKVAFTQWFKKFPCDE